MTVRADLDFSTPVHHQRAKAPSPPRLARVRVELDRLRVGAWDWVSLVLLVAAAMVLLGCTPSSLNVATEVANGTRTVGHEVAAILKEECTDQAVAALHLASEERGPKLLELERKGCSELSATYRVIRVAHVTLHATITAAKAGRCQGVSKSSRQCDLDRAEAAAVAAVLQATDQLRKVAP